MMFKEKEKIVSLEVVYKINSEMILMNNNNLKSINKTEI